MDLPIVNQSGNATPRVLSLTPLAAEKVKELLVQRGTPEHGLRVGVRGGGCSGNSYFMEFCEREVEGDQTILSEGVKLVIDSKSAVVLGGTQIDFVTGLMGSGFKFNNPNVRHSCACGESFST
jgi:iron-sulfur cluster assembly protein